MGGTNGRGLVVRSLHSCTMVLISKGRITDLSHHCGRGGMVLSVRGTPTALRVLMRGAKHIGCNPSVLFGQGKVAGRILYKSRGLAN